MTPKFDPAPDQESISPSHTLFLCTTCGSTWQDGKRVGRSRGEILLEHLQPLHEQWPLRSSFSLQPVQCMSSCDRPCSVAFAAAGKHTYLFGNLAQTDDDDLDQVCQGILECAQLFYQKPNGLMAWSERPQRLKTGIVARIPPVPGVGLGSSQA